MSTGLGRSSREGNGNPLQYSCLENPHGQRSLAGYSPRGRKSQTRLRVKPPPPPQSSPWKSGCIPFKKSESHKASCVAQSVKTLPAMQETQETWVQSPGWEDPLEKEMATHSSILAWRIPWTEEPGGYSPWGHKDRHYLL